MGSRYLVHYGIKEKGDTNMGNWIVGDSDYLAHFGIKGQRWGIRRYQNEDGSLTPEGRERYGVEGNERSVKEAKELQRELNRKPQLRKSIEADAKARGYEVNRSFDKKRLLKGAAAVAGVLVATNVAAKVLDKRINKLAADRARYLYNVEGKPLDVALAKSAGAASAAKAIASVGLTGVNYIGAIHATIHTLKKVRPYTVTDPDTPENEK